MPLTTDSARMARAARNLGAVLAATVLAFSMSGAAAAEPVYSFDTTPGKLPKAVIPVHYTIELRPDLASLALPGVEIVDIEVREPTARLTLNAVNTTFASATIDDDAQRAEIVVDAAAETATLSFPQALTAGPHRLRIGFTAKINKFGTGLFTVDYPTDTGTKRMLSSKLEPADARRIFPCWDEPAFKATFALTVTVPRSFLAVGNMPVVREEPVASDLKRVTFAPTPKMSSYLFVLTTGELERLTAEADGVTVGVVTTAGKSEQGRYALENAVRLLSWFNDYFGVKYPLPKLDLIAVPGGFGGAMENWGGITFFESRLLFDPATSPDTRAARHLQPCWRMRWRTNGSATSSPWAGGTISGSTRALPAGCRRRRPRISIRNGRTGSTATARSSSRWRSTRGGPRIRCSNRSPTRARPWRRSTASPTTRARR